MSHDPDRDTAHRLVKITNSLGLHLRPAQRFAKLASEFQSEIRVNYNGKESNGKSLLDLTLLAAENGTQLELHAHGPDAEVAIAALASLVESQFGEVEPSDSATESAS